MNRAFLPRTASEVSARLSTIYGVDPAEARGVIHIVAAARGPDGCLRALRVGPHAPPSETDFLLLQAVRARADVIVTTAANLRAEPDLAHDLVGEAAAALREYRKHVVGSKEPVHVFVLTQSGDLPADHPAFRDAAVQHVLAPPDSIARAAARVPARTAKHPMPDLSVASAVALARRLGFRTISIEAGPTLARTCYGATSLVDELCLSTYTGRPLGPEALAGALPPDADLLRDRVLSAPSFEAGDFAFSRYLRRLSPVSPP